MSKLSKPLKNYEKINLILRDVSGRVNYHFSDNSVLSCPIRKEIFFDEKGKRIPSTKVIKLFKEKADDLRAERYSLSI